MPEDFNEQDLLNFNAENEDLFGDEFFEGPKDDDKKKCKKKPILLMSITIVLIILIIYVAMKITSNKSSDEAIVSLDPQAELVQEPETATTAPAFQIPTAENNFSEEAEKLLKPDESPKMPQRVVQDIKPVEFNPNKPSVESEVAPMPIKPASVEIPVVKPEKLKTEEPEPSKIIPLKKQQRAALDSTPKGWQVQLISLSDRSKIEAEQTRLLKKYPSLFNNREFAITQAKLSNGKMTNRLRVVGFSGRVSADSFCRSAKSQGVDCYTIPR